MGIRYTPYVDVNGTFLAAHLPDKVNRAALLRRFGETPRVGCVDPEKGYDGEEWTFRADTGDVFNVYARWGQYRIGARTENVEAFQSWLLGELGIVG